MSPNSKYSRQVSSPTVVLISCRFSSLFFAVKVLEAVGTVSWSHACLCNSPSKWILRSLKMYVCVCVRERAWVHVFCFFFNVYARVCVCVCWLRTARVRMVKPPPRLAPSLLHHLPGLGLPVRRWWWRPGSSTTSGVSQAAWWGALGWRESWMAVRYHWSRCGRGSVPDSAVYCFPRCWMCWMQGFRVSCTTEMK